jgi:hypothetical protein
MLVTIRLNLGQANRRKNDSVNRQAALVASSLMTPLAVMAWALAGWRLSADLKWTGDFAIRSGIFSHWQVWIALGLVVQFAAFLLHRYARRDEDRNDTALS